MAYRTFTDRAGVEWQVWDVTPNSSVRHTLSGGWLTFESATEKRRLAPVPLYWVSAGDEELERLLATAMVVPRREEGSSAGAALDTDGERTATAD